MSLPDQEHVVQGPFANKTALEAELDDAACVGLMHAFNRLAVLSRDVLHCLCASNSNAVSASATLLSVMQNCSCTIGILPLVSLATDCSTLHNANTAPTEKSFHTTEKVSEDVYAAMLSSWPHYSRKNCDRFCTACLFVIDPDSHVHSCKCAAPAAKYMPRMGSSTQRALVAGRCRTVRK